jgi:hypothetical protein
VKQKRSGGKSSPVDHTQTDESDLEESFASAVRMVAKEPAEALTPMRLTAMEALVKLGVPIPVAATSLGCGRRVKEWAKLARAHGDRDMPGGFGEGESPYVLWLHRMDAARAYSEASLVSAIAMAAPNDWKAAAWLLERRASKRWHLATRMEIAAGEGNKLEITSFSTDKLIAIARGLLPDEAVKETKALPADITDAEILEDEVGS